MANSIGRGAAIIGLFIIVISIFLPLLEIRNVGRSIVDNGPMTAQYGSWTGLSIYDYIQLYFNHIITGGDLSDFFANPVVIILIILLVAFLLFILYVMVSIVKWESWKNRIWTAGLFMIIFSILLISFFSLAMYTQPESIRLGIGPFFILISGVIWFSPKIKDLYKWLEHRISRG